MAQRYVTPGWKTGEPRRTPVNLLSLDGSRYLVAPRGHAQWVRNLRVAGEGELVLGRKRERIAPDHPIFRVVTPPRATPLTTGNG